MKEIIIAIIICVVSENLECPMFLRNNLSAKRIKPHSEMNIYIKPRIPFLIFDETLLQLI